MGLSEDIAAKVTPFVLDGIKARKKEIRATLPPVQFVFFPIIWVILLNLVPGIVEAIITYILNHRSELKI